jgi:hypothetical protein
MNENFMQDLLHLHKKTRTMCEFHEGCCCLAQNRWLIVVIAILALWEFVWKIIALWKAGRNNHLAWFICIAIFNTIGILPIIYLVTKGRKKEQAEGVK